MQPPSPTSYDDYLRRWEALIVSFLCVGYQRMLDSKGGLKNLFLGGSVITREELERLFETGWAEPEEETDDYDLRAQMEAFYEGLSDDAPFAPEVIYRVFELNDFGFFMLGLAYFLKLNKKYQRIFGYLQDDIRRTDPTLGLAAFLFAPYRAVSAWEAASLFTHPLIRSLLFGGWEEEAHQELYDREIHLSDSIFAYLQGFVLPPAQPFGRVTKPVRAQAAREALLQGLGKKLSAAQAGGAHTLVCFCGAVGAGRTFSARHVAALEGRYLVELDLATLLMRDQQEQCRTVAEIVVDCVLHGYWLYLREVPTEPPQCERALELLRTLCKTLPVVALSCTGNGDMFHLSGVAVCRVELDMPDAAQSLRYWQVCAGAFSLAADLSSLAGRYRLLPGDIRAALRLAALEQGSSGTITQAALETAIQQNSFSRLSTYATDVRLVYGWEDLKLPQAQQLLLRNAMDRIKYRYQVMSEWGFDRKLAYGRGLSMLFYGPPGTGKTMGAQVMARELGLRLYRIDLSQTMSKYIGETEKNLADIFERAKHCNAILFFDEADALFGKRSEVKDSKDKYANLETAYLLQKMEEHDGISILATNRVSDFDDAFRRRITCMVEFPMPTEEIRLELWRSMIPEHAPTGHLDFEFLAEKFPVSGSTIKSIVISAAYLAASGGGPLTMAEIIRALKQERLKTGSVVWESDFERYVGFLKDTDPLTGM